MQFNLTPETQHEKDFMKLLEKYDGNIGIHKGVSVIRTQGEYLRCGDSNDVATVITIDKKVTQ